MLLEAEEITSYISVRLSDYYEETSKSDDVGNVLRRMLGM
jgi:hypothetical protein